MSARPGHHHELLDRRHTRGRGHSVGSLLLALALCLPSGAVQAQTPGFPGPDARAPRVGLVLSGGSARGFAHVGVIRVLEAAGVRVDVVTGTSMGSVIGGMYAAGYSPDDMVGVAAGADWDRLFSDAPERRNLSGERKEEEGRWVVTLPIRDGRPALPGGLVSGQRISQFLTRLMWDVHPIRDFRRLPIPFAAVATDAGTGNAVRLDHGFLPRAIRASIAIPGVFAPVEIDGQLLTDGGVARNLPAEDALALGADVLICSDVSKPLAPADSLTTLLAVLDQTIAYRSWASTLEQRELCDILIVPEIQGISSASFDRAKDWVQRGEDAARTILSQLEALGLVRARSVGAPVSATTPAAAADPAGQESAATRFERDSVYIAAVVVEGLDNVSERFVLDRIGVAAPAWVPLARIDRGVTRLHDTGRFRKIEYRLDAAKGAGAGSTGRTLQISVHEQSYGLIGFGYRYESRFKGSLLGSLVATELLGGASRLAVDLRIGEQGMADGRMFWRLGHRPQFLLGVRAGYRRMPFDIYEGDLRVSTPRAYVSTVGLGAGVGLGSAGALGLRIKAEYADLDEFAAAGPPFTGDSGWLCTAAGALELDTYDRASFPRSGVGVHAKTEWAEESTGCGSTFQQHAVDVQGVVPASRRVSILGRLVAGTSSGSLPDHYHFFLGGTNQYYVFPDRQYPFAGLRALEKRGRHVQMAQLGVQVQLQEILVGRIRANAGAALEEWEVNADLLEWGFDITLAAVTRFGTAALSLAGTDFRTLPRLVIDVGFLF